MECQIGYEVEDEEMKKSEEVEEEEEEEEVECLERWWRRGAADFGGLSGVWSAATAVLRGQLGPTWPTATSFVRKYSAKL